MNVLNRVMTFITQFVTPIYVLRAPIIAVVFGSVLLALPDQALEIMRALALDRSRFWPQIVLAFATLFFAGAFIWYLGRALTFRWLPAEISQNNVTGFMSRWLPRVLGATPLLAAALGQWRAGELLTPITLTPWIESAMPDLVPTVRAAAEEFAFSQQLLLIGSLIALGLGALLILITFLRTYGRPERHLNPNPWVYGAPTRLFFFVFTTALVAAFSGYFLGDPTKYGLLANQLGTFAIFNLFLICFAFFLTVLTNIYDRTHFPAFSLVLIVAFLSTAFDLNDNHEIRTIDGAFPRLPNSQQAIHDWLDSRPDRAYFTSKSEPYPIYIVAAEGGGLYAAQHTALMLGRMQDRCPAFAQHVFAISGVSGGGLGGAVFSSLVKQKNPRIAQPACAFGPQPAGWYEQRTNDFLGRDFIAPLAAAGFFPDFLQRVLPFPVKPFDRARALEASFERAWSESVPEATENPFAGSYYAHWKVDGTAPAVVLNAAHVSTGIRTIISPFRFYQEATAKLETLNTLIRSDMPLSTAVGIGSRFPWILPPASWRRGPLQYRFVDGGYFEASGIDTAHDLITVFEDYLRSEQEAGHPDPNIHIQLIVLSTDDILQDPVLTPNAATVAAAHTARSGFDELFSPLETLLNTRWQRGVVSVGREFHKFCPDCFLDREDRRVYPGLDGDARVFRINFTDFPLTLGWHLSHVTQTLISAHSGFADRCIAARQSITSGLAWAAQVLNENNCAACSIMYTVTGRAKELETVAPSVRTESDALKRGPIAQSLDLCRAEAGNVAAPAYSMPKPPGP